MRTSNQSPTGTLEDEDYGSEEDSDKIVPFEDQITEMKVIQPLTQTHESAMVSNPEILNSNEIEPHSSMKSKSITNGSQIKFLQTAQQSPSPLKIQLSNT